MKGPTCGPSQRVAEAGGSLTLEAQARAGAAPTKSGRAGTARRLGSGERDGKVQRAVNRWWNPLQRYTGSNLADLGRTAAHARFGWRLPDGVKTAGREAMGKGCGVPMARLQGKSRAPHPSTGCVVNVGTVPVSPSLSDRAESGQARCRLMAPEWGGAPVVVRGRESRPHGDGGQRVRSVGSGTPGGRR